MEGPLYCFNCGKPTDLVTDAYGAICRDCLNARKGEAVPAEAEEEEKPKPKTRAVKRGSTR